ncbi:MAG: TetR/AcrR family transcriptional regulator [Bernardetiaceae bacterium]
MENIISEEDKKIDTETAIKNAAKKVFLMNGLKGARMQAIADEAGINRSMLHYYFRSKEKLFEVVFADAMREMNDRMGAIAESDTDIFQKIEHFIRDYSRKASENPEFDLFLMNEFRQDPKFFEALLNTSSTGKSIRSFIVELEKAVKDGVIVGDAKQIFLSVIGACLFPFAGMTFMRTLMGEDEANYQQLLEQRIRFLTEFLIKGIKP